jgi:hypothetical protein
VPQRDRGGPRDVGERQCGHDTGRERGPPDEKSAQHRATIPEAERPRLVRTEILAVGRALRGEGDFVEARTEVERLGGTLAFADSLTVQGREILRGRAVLAVLSADDA